MELAQLGNAYFDAKKPWVLVKDPLTHEDVATPSLCCLECLKMLALVSFPIIPETAEKLYAILGFKKSS